MTDPIIYSFPPPLLDKPIHGLLDAGQSIRTSCDVSIEDSYVTQPLFGNGYGYFITTASGSRYTLVVLPVSALQAWLADFLHVPILRKEVLNN